MELSPRPCPGRQLLSPRRTLSSLFTSSTSSRYSSTSQLNIFSLWMRPLLKVPADLHRSPLALLSPTAPGATGDPNVPGEAPCWSPLCREGLPGSGCWQVVNDYPWVPLGCCSWIRAFLLPHLWLLCCSRLSLPIAGTFSLSACPTDGFFATLNVSFFCQHA